MEVSSSKIILQSIRWHYGFLLPEHILGSQGSLAIPDGSGQRVEEQLDLLMTLTTLLRKAQDHSSSLHLSPIPTRALCFTYLGDSEAVSCLLSFIQEILMPPRWHHASLSFNLTLAYPT